MMPMMTMMKMMTTGHNGEQRRNVRCMADVPLERTTTRMARH